MTSGEATGGAAADRAPSADRITMALVAAGVLGGSLHTLKGAVLLLGGPDLALVPAMLLLFGLGMFALHRTLVRSDGWFKAGAVVAGTTVAFGAASVGCQVMGWQPEDPVDPVVADIAYGGGTLAVLVGLLLLGIAWSREASIAPPWRLVPLVVGIVWFPLEALTAVTPDGVGLALAGLSWIAAALAPVFATVRHPAAPH